MALDVTHLNADTTFLITLAPAWAPRHARSKVPGSCTILFDPWLAGTSSIWSPRFQLSRHTKPPAIDNLRHIPLPNLIIVSQGKPDHCHKETLCTLAADAAVTIVAVPDAARQIKSWKHFQSAKIIVLDVYNPKVAATLVRLPLEAYMEASAPGEVTIAHLSQPGDVSGLHNAIAVTYRAPGSTYISQLGVEQALPLTPPVSPNTGPAPLTLSPRVPSQSISSPKLAIESTLSMLYTPHGITRRAIESYMSTHLRACNALPLTALFHAVNVEQNPWFMGGRVVSGLPGGIDLINLLGAKHWFSAHDEDKDNRGLATAMIKSKIYTVVQAQDELDVATRLRTDLPRTLVFDLDVGETFRSCSEAG